MYTQGGGYEYRDPDTDKPVAHEEIIKIYWSAPGMVGGTIGGGGHYELV